MIGAYQSLHDFTIFHWSQGACKYLIKTRNGTSYVITSMFCIKHVLGIFDLVQLQIT